MKLIKLAVALAIVVTSCTTEDEKMQKYLIGNWEETYLKFELPSYQGKDTLVEYDIDFANPHDPRAKERGKTFYTYNSDGTFEMWKKDVKAFTGKSTKGKWRATKDSLFWDIDQRGKTYTVPFGLKQIEDGYSMIGIRDFDKDGKKDDSVFIETVRLPDTEK